MASKGGFGREFGPSAPPKSQPLFGHFPRSPSPSHPSPVPIAANSPPSHPSPVPNAANFPTRALRSYKDLDALYDVPSSLPFNSAHPTTGFTDSPATLDRQSSFQRGGRQSLADKDFSKQILTGPSAVDTIYSESRTQLLVSRPQDLQQAKSPSFPYADERSWRNSITDAVGGDSVSLPRSVPKKKILRVTHFPSHLVQTSSGHGDIDANKDPIPAVSKRSRSPPVADSQVFLGKSYSTEGVDDRELEAKAKRLARFKTDFSVPTVSSVAAKNDRLKLEKQRVVGDYMESAENASGDVDNEDPQPPSVIVGLCSDMCPVSEREERERKGDLDQYERFDGDRNQSSKELAVKKYTRTAEREAELIRPLPILQKTMDYLLSLLDQPYGDSFLGLYNFLWDRMRAIRMDLRMQHIFNLEAITMLEQMIRLHIIAMHELCEYTKGEGFSEGFDAHLNIEQMNKTSVELFQMYEDYRKKGVYVPTEKEFRGYYALLKLDKHPGYKVEPSELSLDLANMTPEIRQTNEVLFARNVARSCRTGNFIAFFRLGVKASYLQACLMHAHFSKLRTQALASLHSGLQNNQGIPVAHVAKWLGLESEGVESLLEYHGFSIKEFDELYMVKEGPFLNIDKDFPTRCSELVHLKKSKHILEDVLSPHQVTPILTQASKEVKPIKVNADKPIAVLPVQRGPSLRAVPEELSDLNVSPSPKRGMQLQHELKRAGNQLSSQENRPSIASSPKQRMQAEPAPCMLLDQHNKAGHDQYIEKSSQPWNFSIPKPFSEIQQVHVEKMPEETPELPSPAPPKNKVPSILQQMPLVKMTRNVEQEHCASAGNVIANAVQHDMVVDKAKGDECTVAHDFHDEEVIAHCYDEEVAKAKLKLFLRLWRRRCAAKRELREQKRLAAYAALNSLSVGPPIQRKQERRKSYERFNIDELTNKRYKKLEESWSRFSVSDLVADILREQNPRSSCICWKVVLCSHTHMMNHATYSSADQWLHSKLVPSTKDECSDDLVISSPGLAIWRKWVTEQSQSSCCLSVIKSINFSNLNEGVAGSSGVVFLLSEDIELESQKRDLQNLVASLQYGSCMPLLILSSSIEEEDFVVEKLGLNELDRSRISSFLIAQLHESSQDMKRLVGYFSDNRLKEGLKWLASKSHPQPVLLSIKTRELVMSHLNTSLGALDHYKAGPNHCISAFNDALDKSAEEVVSAASANPMGWPCPELSLLHEYGMLLPSIGWSTAEAIEPLLSALRQCKLPVFLDDTSFLNKGSVAGHELEEQRLHLQDCLISYLNQTSKMMNLTMAMKEASIMLQTNARLELRSTSYYVVPDWVFIFRRVFNWRLSVLSSSEAYILEKCVDPPSEKHEEESDLIPVTSYLDYPSLDEMMEVSLVSPAPMTQDSPVAGTSAHENSLNKITEASPLDLVSEHTSQIQPVQDYDAPLGVNNTSDSSCDLMLPAIEEDRLTQLIEKCNMVQNKIGEKLSIYF